MNGTDILFTEKYSHWNHIHGYDFATSLDTLIILKQKIDKTFYKIAHKVSPFHMWMFSIDKFLINFSFVGLYSPRLKVNESEQFENLIMLFTILNLQMFCNTVRRGFTCTDNTQQKIMFDTNILLDLHSITQICTKSPVICFSYATGSWSWE